MADPKLPPPAKLFCAVLWHDAAARDAAVQAMVDRWGPVDFTGPDRPFDMTDYYAPEMGADLQRRIVSFRELVPSEQIGAYKRIANEIEQATAAGDQRRVNLDIGYLDHNKLILASCKYAGQKIHLGEGYYADLVARYRKGRYQPFEWTFPDFRDGRYDNELGEIRHMYMGQLKARA